MCDVIAKYESCKMADLPPCWIANVLPHLSWRERVIVGSLNRAWRDVLNKQEWYWNMMCRCLQEEEGVYLSADVLSNTKDSQLLFKELWRIRKEWNQHTQVAVEEELVARPRDSRGHCPAAGDLLDGRLAVVLVTQQEYLLQLKDFHSAELCMLFARDPKMKSKDIS